MPSFPKSVPFWLFDESNFGLIVSKSIPTSMNESKKIVFAEVSIPGGDFSDKRYASMGAEEVSFSIKIVNFNNSIGNAALLSQFRNLRSGGKLWDLAFVGGARAFNPNPKVLCWWGTGKFAPMHYRVEDVGMNHQNHNRLGFPQVTDISLKLSLDHSGVLYKIEDVFTKVASIAGMGQGLYKLISGKNPYRGLL